MQAKSVGKSALHFAVGTFFSRISGMLREIAMAFTLGTSAAAAAFLVAFRFAYLLRRILGEGALVNGFVPHYEAMRLASPQKAALFFRDLLATLGAVLLLIIGFTEIALAASLHFQLFSPENREIVRLVMLMLPGLFFICFFALQSGLLQCHGQFLLTGIAPAAFNVAWIGTLLWHRHDPASTITTHLALSLGAAFLIQWILLLRHTTLCLKGLLSLKDWLKSTLFSTEIRAMLKAIALSIIAVSATQINSFIDMLFARYADLEGPAYLSYAIRLQQLPLSLFGIAIASAVFPSLARAVQGQDEDKARELLSFGLLRSTSLMLPCTLGMIALGSAAVNLLFGRGNFTDVSTAETTFCLWGYGFGLIPATYALLFSQAFFVRKDFVTPTTVSIASVLFSTACNAGLVLLLHAGAVSIALTTSLAAIFQATLLIIIYNRRYGSVGFWTTHRLQLFKLVLASFAATVLASTLASPCSRDFLLQLRAFFLPAAAFAAAFITLSWVLRIDDIRALLLRTKK